MWGCDAPDEAGAEPEGGERFVSCRRTEARLAKYSSIIRPFAQATATKCEVVKNV